MSLHEVCMLFAYYVDDELLERYLPGIWPVFNQAGLQRLLYDVLADNTLSKGEDAEYRVHFLKLCGLLYCDNNTPLYLKQLIMHRLIPKYSRFTVNANHTFLKEMWLFCNCLSRSESKQQQTTAYALFEKIVHLYAPKYHVNASFEIRMETNLESFLLRGLTFSPIGDNLDFSADIQAATLSITKNIISFNQQFPSSITNRFLWDKYDAIKWRETWKSYIELYELIGEVEELTECQICSIKNFFFPNARSSYLGFRWVACLIRRGLVNIHPIVRLNLLSAISVSIHRSNHFDYFVIYELPSLLDHDHIYSFNEEDPLQRPSGQEVSQRYYKYLCQGRGRKNWTSIVERLIADLCSVENYSKQNFEMNPMNFIERNIEFTLISLLTLRISPNPLILASLKSHMAQFFREYENFTSPSILQLRKSIESASDQTMGFHQVALFAHVIVAVEGAFKQTSSRLSFASTLAEKSRQRLIEQIAKAADDFKHTPLQVKDTHKQVRPGTSEDHDALLCALDLLKDLNN